MRISFVSSLAAVATIVAAPALAADLRKAPAAVPVAVEPTVQSLWSGLHVGLNAGVGGGDTVYPLSGSYTPGDTTYDFSGSGHMNGSGALFGAQIGYDRVFANRVLLGIEADVDWSNIEDRVSIDGSASQGGALVGSASGHLGTELEYLGTVRARLGYLVTDPWLLYVTGGWAFGGVKSSWSLAVKDDGGAIYDGLAYGGSKSNFMSGWAAGIGTAYAVSPNLSVRAEYLHVDLGSRDIATFRPGSLVAGLKIEPAYDLVRVGVDYRFDATAPATALQPAAFAAPKHFDWTGLHVGVNGGYGMARDDYPASYATTSDDVVTAVSGTAHLNGGGMLGGLQIGYDHQFQNRMVVGLEADIDWSGVRGRLGASGSARDGTSLVGTAGASAGTDLQYLGTVRARVGYAVTEPWLVYATGGWAYGGTESTADYGLSGSGGNVSKKLTHSGWTVGVGSEFAVTPNLTVRADYLHVDFPSKTLWSGGGDTTRASLSVDPSYDLVRLGVNYKFDFGSHPRTVVAKD